MSIRECKIVFLGSSGVGKTSLVRSFVTKSFTPNVDTTIGASYLTKVMRVDSVGAVDGVGGMSQIVKFNVWDTAGQEKYESLTSMYYRNTDAAILVYDVTDASSFKKMKQWADTLKSNLDGKAVLIAVGNKVDLLKGDDGKRAVRAQEVNDFVSIIGASYVETSAKENIDVDEAFKRIVHLLPPVQVGYSDEDQIKLQLGGRRGSDGWASACC